MKRSVIALLFSSLLFGYAASSAWSAAGDAPKPGPAAFCYRTNEATIFV
jgi:hypothetical protein